MSSEKFYFVGIDHASAEARLLFDVLSLDRPPSRRAMSPTDVAGLTRLTKFRCTGSYNLLSGESEVCRSGKLPSRAGQQCTECWTLSGFNPAFYNVSKSELSEQQQKYNLEPHSVYLAHFGASQIKIGIANARRLNLRWKEQGALAAIELFRATSAYDARHLELKVHSGYGFPEAVRSNRKIEGLLSRQPEEEMLRELQDDADRLRRDFGLATDERPRIVYARRLYAKVSEANEVMVTNASSPLTLRGPIVSIIGGLMVWTADRIAITTAQKFLGHQVWPKSVDADFADCKSIARAAQQENLF